MTKYKTSCVLFSALILLISAAASARSLDSDADPMSIGVLDTLNNDESKNIRSLVESIYFTFTFARRSDRFPENDTATRDIIFVVLQNSTNNFESLNITLLKEFDFTIPTELKFFSPSAGCVLYPFSSSDPGALKFLAAIFVEQDNDIAVESACASALLSAIFGVDLTQIQGKNFSELMAEYFSGQK
ncbi:MAG: hypothetical protein AAGG69_06790 [Pseudomonadota bacterium]